MLLNRIHLLNVQKTNFIKQSTLLCSQLLILHIYMEVLTFSYSSFTVLHKLLAKRINTCLP